MAIKVCIDAGHGGKDQGAVKDKRYEKDDTLNIALLLGKVLEKNGIEVTYTRTIDTYSSPSSKAKIGNNLKADFFISIHRNASILKRANGVETFVYTKKGLNYSIAKAITNRLAVIGFTNRGVKVNKMLTVLECTLMPTMLINIGFITNTKDNSILDNNMIEVVNAIAKGFLTSQGLQFKPVKVDN